jgi:hypothetical protein
VPSSVNAAVLENIATTILKTNVTVPAISTAAHTFNLSVEYIGIPKDRNGRIVSSGLPYKPNRFSVDRSEWIYTFTEDALKGWFIPGWTSEEKGQPAATDTLYSVLGILQNEPQEKIKKAYRVAAMTWHPDRNSDPKATDKFREVQTAYEVLRDPRTRMKYDAGLALQATLLTPPPRTSWKRYSSQDWRPPIRCGHITCEGIKLGESFRIEKIVSWKPITNQFGQTMVTTWRYGATMPDVTWV